MKRLRKMKDLVHLRRDFHEGRILYDFIPRIIYRITQVIKLELDKYLVIKEME